MNPQPATGVAASTAAHSRPEVLAPAGNFACLRAAVENGADAVYFGVQKYNARARAANFPLEELPDVLRFLRLRGVKGYVAFNTLIFSTELDDARRTLETILAAGPDALILQDLGIARLVRAMCPDVALHASTQTTTSSAEQCEYLQDLGFSRVILARELSVADVRKIKAATDLPLEVFVHGALCVAYSGQCLTSEALGGRSANRGACAQACRLPYDLFVDGARRDLGDRAYLISPQDLAAFDLVPEMLGLVCSIKIEGRLKSPEYVAATVRTYRKAVDDAAAKFTREEVLALEQVFSRGLSHGFLGGIDHQKLVPALSPKKRGILLGHVQSVRDGRVRLRLSGPLKPGDGLVFDYGKPEEDEPGGRVVHLWRDGRRVEAADAPDTVELELRDCPPPQFGWKVWKTDDPALNRRLRSTFERTGRRVPLDAVVEEAGGNLRITLSDGAHTVSGDAGPVQPAEKRPLTEEYLRAQLGRLGATPFELRGLESRIGRVMVPVSRINELRRQLIEELQEARQANPGFRIDPKAGERLLAEVSAAQRSARAPLPDALAEANPAAPARAVRPSTAGTPRATAGRPSSADTPTASCRLEHDSRDRTVRLVALCRSPGQLDAALAEGVSEVECDFEDLRLYPQAVARAHAVGAQILLAPPRILKPGETGFLETVRNAEPDGVLVRSTAHLSFFAGLRLIGDYSLNAANELAADWLLAQGLERIVPSYDLSWEQLAALVERIDPARVEMVVHQHMPMFHMEHCVFAALLSTGKDCTDCGRPCDRHALALRDWSGMVHPVKADAGCRNTIFNAVAQSASTYVRGLLERGVRWFRVELLRETPDEARRLLRGYREVIEGRNDGRTLWQELRASNVMGVTRGPLGRQ